MDVYALPDLFFSWQACPCMPPPPAMDVYLYRSECQRWWGRVHDVRLVQVDTQHGEDPRQAAAADARFQSGSETCNIDLLQKFRLSFESMETFQPMFASLPIAKPRIPEEEDHHRAPPTK